MKNKNEQGFALVLSLVLMLAMSLMGGALIVISAGLFTFWREYIKNQINEGN